MTSSQRDVSPPQGGTPPPAIAELPNGERLLLTPLAAEIGRRFYAEFPDELDRYGPAGRDWCQHDNQWLLAWAVEDLAVGGTHFASNVRWLAGLLRARGYPVERLGRDLEIAGDVVAEEGAAFAEVAARLRRGARLLRGRSRR
jgi:hypothetical protein